MFNVSRNGIITMNRGDTWDTPLFLNLGTSLEPTPFIPSKNDFIYFGLMEPNQPFECAIVKKTFTNKDFDEETLCLTLSFSSCDTENLLPGTYYYEIKLCINQGTAVEEVHTIVPKTKFIIVE